jgi:hypothetical protein
LALAAYAIITLVLFPWHLAYFNLLAGGVEGGYRYLTDSNLDWGQTWKALRRYLDEQGIAEFGLSQYTINDPHAYDLDYRPLPPWPDAPPVLPRRFNPAPGIYAISATTLQGVVVADSEMFDYFRKLDPIARVGHAMFVYDVKAPPSTGGSAGSPTWAAQCTNPVVPLTPNVLTEGLGRDDLRLVYFDCSQSWLYPPGNGWYVLAREREAWAPSQAPIQRARLAYEQIRPSAVPPFEVYEWFELEPLVKPEPISVNVAPSAWSPEQARQQGAVLQTPVRVGDELEFLGYVVPDTETRAGWEIGVQTYWRVVQTPAQPLSLMAHLLDANGAPIAVGDGLGVPIDQWGPGDVIVQYHQFKIASETAPGVYWPQFGAYTLPDVRRMPIWQDGIPVGDRMLVGEIEVIAR